MNIKGIDAVVLGVEDLASSRRFFEEFGLIPHEVGASGATLLSTDRTAIELRGNLDLGLPAAVTGGSTIREAVWGVPEDADLSAIAAELSRDRDVRVDQDNVVHSTDDDGYGIAFRVTRRDVIEPAPNLLNIYGAEPGRAINRRVDFLEAVRPAAVAHVVVKSPDVARAKRFYTERLGFRISDEFAGNHGAFLRSAGSPYHHNLFLICSPERGLHHVAFAVTDFNEVMIGGQAMIEAGWESRLGPGRHVIGSNYFWYFHSPCGGAMELTADMDRADDDWVMGEWEYIPQNTMAWSMDFRHLPGQGRNRPLNAN
jgi:catechol 2,3-dioxygenase-like lactoylglutathione lyase family enzyme